MGATELAGFAVQPKSAAASFPNSIYRPVPVLSYSVIELSTIQRLVVMRNSGDSLALRLCT